jgi:hypothetical protein
MQGVSAMPTFIFYRNKAKLDRIQGADVQALEAKIKAHYGSDSNAEDESYGQGLMNLNSFIQKNMCECLNESDDHTLEHCLNAESGRGFLASDCDEQLIITIAFNSTVKLHSIKFKTNNFKQGPKNVKLFINLPVTFDFDQAAVAPAVQEFEVAEKNLKEGIPIELRFVKFQTVQNITIFVADNHSGSETTIIDELAFIGTPHQQQTKMDDFKRISGKKGESH